MGTEIYRTVDEAENGGQVRTVYGKCTIERGNIVGSAWFGLIAAIAGCNVNSAWEAAAKSVTGKDWTRYSTVYPQSCPFSKLNKGDTVPYNCPITFSAKYIKHSAP